MKNFYNNSTNFYVNLLSFLVAFVPVLLITGPFLSDLVVSSCSIIFIIVSIKNKLSFYYTNKIFIISLFFCIYLIFLSLSSLDPRLSLESSMFYIRFIIFSLCVWYVCQNNNIYFLKTLFLIIVIAYLFLIIDSYLQFFTHYNLFGMYKMAEHRHSGIFGTEYILGSYLVRFIPLLIGLFLFFEIFNKYRIFSYVFFSLIFGLIFISGERSALCLLIIVLIYFVLTVKERRKDFLKIIGISTIPIIISSFFNYQVYERMIIKTANLFLNQDLFSTTSAFSLKAGIIFPYMYTQIYTTGISIFKDNIFFGIGPKMFRVYCNFPEYFIKDGCTTHPHNTYLQLLVETGLFGFLIISFLFLFIVYKMIIINKKNKGLYPKIKHLRSFLYLSLFISLCPILPTGNFFNNWLSIVYFFPIGMIISTYNSNFYNNIKT